MNKVFDFLLLHRRALLKFGILLTVLKALSVIASLFLPTHPVLPAPRSKPPLYFSFSPSYALSLKQEPVQKPRSGQKAAQFTLDGLTLKAVWAESAGGGFILLHDSSGKPFILGRGEEYSGYVLDRVLPKKCVFKKDGKEFLLTMKDDESKINIQALNHTQQAVQTKSRVSKDEISMYKKNLNLIWDNISIEPHYEGNDIRGFDVLAVKAGSVFSELGLQKGDRIVKANEVELKSIGDAFMVYRQVDTIRTFKLTVIRDGLERDLEYELY